jgi:hypothetical protein
MLALLGLRVTLLANAELAELAMRRPLSLTW